MCDYTTCRGSQYDRHLLTRKHEIRKNTKVLVRESCEKVPKSSASLSCSCGKTYKHSSSLWNHQQKCTLSNNNPVVIDKAFIMTILKQNSDIVKENSELKTMMMDNQEIMLQVIKAGTHTITNNTNSNNKTFNLQFFLNDTCKDAMNITDFVNNIQLQLSDLEKMGDIGYVNGISSIIVKKLKDMDVNSRPIHCTDVKREIMYVKDEDKWDKEENGNPKIRHAIKHIAFKNTKLLNQFKDKYPDYNNSSSRVSDNYNKILIESMGGKGDNDLEKENKIIRNITKEVTVEKE